MKVVPIIFLFLLSVLIGRGGGARGGGARGFSGARSASVSTGVKSAPVAAPHIASVGGSMSSGSGFVGSSGGAKPISANSGLAGGTSGGIYPIPIGGGIHSGGFEHRNLTKNQMNI